MAKGRLRRSPSKEGDTRIDRLFLLLLPFLLVAEGRCVSFSLQFSLCSFLKNKGRGNNKEKKCTHTGKATARSSR